MGCGFGRVRRNLVTRARQLITGGFKRIVRAHQDERDRTTDVFDRLGQRRISGSTAATYDRDLRGRD